MHSSTSLFISSKSAITRTQEIQQQLNDRFSYIVFYPEMADTTDLQAKEFCDHLRSLKEFAGRNKFDETLDQPIKNSFAGIPDLEETDFDFGVLGLPSFLFYLVLPVGIFTWIYRYYKLTDIRNKLGEALSKMNTAVFYLKATESYL